MSALQVKQRAVVLAEFGATMYICQMFESSLCFLHALVSEDQNPGSFHASWDFHSEKTLGALIDRLKKRLPVSQEVAASLEKGLKLRNEIVHGFLTRNLERLKQSKEHAGLISELHQMKMAIKSSDASVNKLADTFLSKYGLSNDLLKEHANALMQLARDRDYV